MSDQDEASTPHGVAITEVCRELLGLLNRLPTKYPAQAVFDGAVLAAANVYHQLSESNKQQCLIRLKLALKLFEEDGKLQEEECKH
jgi:hypothetical protein